MDNIFEANRGFDFSKLSLAQPSSIQGGAYFTKIQHGDKPLYIETPKSLTKQGFMKNGKKMFIDLMFDSTSEDFIQWIENLETKCQELIYQNGDSWFQNKLEMNDIESAFTSPLKIYKSGKFYLLRVNVKMNYSTNNPYIKIYNESEVPLSIDDVNTDTNIISIIEVQGIKFTSRNFQIEIEVKQMMTMNTNEIFENCLIKKATKKTQEEPMVQRISLETMEKEATREEGEEDGKEDGKEYGKEDGKEEGNEDGKEEGKEEGEENQDKNEEKDNTTDSIIVEQEGFSLEKTKEEGVQKSLELLSLDLDPFTEELLEININTSNEDLETIHLKKPNQVYYEIYKEARKKAKQAKKDAIVAFLEAKNIKKTYMLEDLEDSEDSQDSDMDNFSEEEYEMDDFDN